MTLQNRHWSSAAEKRGNKADERKRGQEIYTGSTAKMDLSGARLNQTRKIRRSGKVQFRRFSRKNRTI